VGTNRELEQVIQIIRSDDFDNYHHDYRAHKVRTLSEVGPEAIPFLVELLDGAYGYHTFEAFEALGKLRASLYPDAMAREREALEQALFED